MLCGWQPAHGCLGKEGGEEQIKERINKNHTCKYIHNTYLSKARVSGAQPWGQRCLSIRGRERF